MKKLTLILTLLLVMAFSFSAMAEAATTELVAPENCPFEGAWLSIHENFNMYTPADWSILEVSEEKVNAGIIASFASPDATQTLDIAWQELSEDYTIEQIAKELTADTTNEEVESVDINGITFVSYERSAQNLFGAVFMDANYYGMYNMIFTPLSDEATQHSAVAMLTSIQFLTPAE